MAVPIATASVAPIVAQAAAPVQTASVAPIAPQATVQPVPLRQLHHSRQLLLSRHSKERCYSYITF